MAASSSDLQALQLEIRNLQQKIDFQHREIKKRDMHIRDLRDGVAISCLGVVSRINELFGTLTLPFPQNSSNPARHSRTTPAAQLLGVKISYTEQQGAPQQGFEASREKKRREKPTRSRSANLAIHSAPRSGMNWAVRGSVV